MRAAFGEFGFETWLKFCVAHRARAPTVSPRRDADLAPLRRCDCALETFSPDSLPCPPYELALAYRRSAKRQKRLLSHKRATAVPTM